MLTKWVFTLLLILGVGITCTYSQSDSSNYKLVEKAEAVIDHNVDSALFYAKVLSGRKLDSTLLLKTFNLLGNCLQRKGNLDSAMYYYKKVEELSIAMKDDKGMAIVLNNIGIIHINKGEYDQALKAIYEAVEYEKLVNDSTGMAEGYLNIGVIYYYMGDLENTLKYFKISSNISKALGDLRVLKKAYINIGAIHSRNKEYDEAIEYYEYGLEVSEELNDQADAVICLHNMADVYTIQGKYKKAEENYRKAMDFYKKFDNRRGVALEHTKLGILYNKIGEYDKSERSFKRSAEMADSGKYFNVSESAYQGLTNLYVSQKKFKLAFEATQELQKRRDSVYTIEKAKNMDELRTKYETAEKEKMLALEKSRTDSLTMVNAVIEEKKAKAELETANRNQWIIALASILLTSLFVFWGLMQRQRLKAQKERQAALIEERDKRIEAVFNAQEEERKRISKDLHDGIGQQLTALKMAFQQLRPKIDESSEVKSELNKLGGILNQTASDIRTISHQMMPKTLSEVGLIAAIEDLLDKYIKPTGINWRLENLGIEQRLNQKMEVNLYRIIQELLNNVIKHSKADEVILQLIKNQNRLILIVEDNGIGFQNGQSDGHGLLNIKSRLNMLKGEMEIEAGPVKGSLTTIRIPLT